MLGFGGLPDWDLGVKGFRVFRVRLFRGLGVQGLGVEVFRVVAITIGLYLVRREATLRLWWR